jgi:mono/diheme cytochrome c family protein
MRGARAFGMHCFICHGMNAAAAGAAPDLRAAAWRSPLHQHAAPDDERQSK